MGQGQTSYTGKELANAARSIVRFQQSLLPKSTSKQHCHKLLLDKWYVQVDNSGARLLVITTECCTNNVASFTELL